VSAVASLYQPSAKFPLNLNRRSVEIEVLVQSLLRRSSIRNTIRFGAELVSKGSCPRNTRHNLYLSRYEKTARFNSGQQSAYRLFIIYNLQSQDFN